MPTNVNDATYFELRLIEEICEDRNLPFRFQDELRRSLVLLRKSHGRAAQLKIEIQELRLKTGLLTFKSQVSQLEGHLAKKLTDIEWVGRKNIGERVADIDLFFGKDTILPISAKSGGPGTERNLGGDSLYELLGYDSSDTIEKMKVDSLKTLTSNFPDIKFGNSWKQIRDSIKSNPSSRIMTSLANEVGKRYQPLISGEIVKAWKDASDKQKLALISYLALQNDARDRGLQIFVAEDSRAYFKDTLNISDLKAQDISLINHPESLNGTLELLIRNQRYWRLNVNFTNGLGLSPIAVRVFLI